MIEGQAAVVRRALTDVLHAVGACLLIAVLASILAGVRLADLLGGVRRPATAVPDEGREGA